MCHPAEYSGNQYSVILPMMLMMMVMMMRMVVSTCGVVGWFGWTADKNLQWIEIRIFRGMPVVSPRAMSLYSWDFWIKQQNESVLTRIFILFNIIFLKKLILIPKYLLWKKIWKGKWYHWLVYKIFYKIDSEF